MSRCLPALALASVLLAGASVPALAQTAPAAAPTTAPIAESPDLKLATDSAAQEVELLPPALTPDDAWQNWLLDNNLTDGENRMPDGRTFFIASGSAQVRGAPGEKGWVRARQAAFETALIQAKNRLAESIGTTIESGRALTLFSQGGEPVPSAMQEAGQQLSVMDKALTLADKALDHEIRKYDPAWDGTGKSQDERVKKVVALQERYEEQIAQRARAFLQGAVPVANFEGPNADGDYSVLVGIVWSSRTSLLAESIYNPQVAAPKRAPQSPIVEQIRAMVAADPDALAVAQGVRTWTDENGDQVVVSFSPVERSSSSAIDENQAAVRARAQIAQFVSEAVTSGATLEGGLAFREYQDGTSDTFDDSAFQQRIEAHAKQINLAGAVRAYSWQGKHPFSERPMRVDIYAWSPSSRDMAGTMRELSEEQEDRMSRHGRPAPAGQPGGAQSAQPVAEPVRGGPTSNPTDF